MRMETHSVNTIPQRNRNQLKRGCERMEGMPQKSTESIHFYFVVRMRADDQNSELFLISDNRSPSIGDWYTTCCKSDAEECNPSVWR